MCGRYEFKLGASKIASQIKDQAEKSDLVFKQGEVFPDDDVLCIVAKGEKIELKVMKWGIRGTSFQINARIESLNDSFFYKKMKDKRCAVICNGFYEWDKEKTKYYFSTDDEYVYLAAVYNDDNELLIITSPADEHFAKIHDRKPVVMDMKMMLDYVRGKTEILSVDKLKVSVKNEQMSLL